jgi:hypothetical protein
MMYTPSMSNLRADSDENNRADHHLAKYVFTKKFYNHFEIYVTNIYFRIGGIPARTAAGENLSLYVGIIDILQSYELRKKLEHTLKSVVTDGVKRIKCQNLISLHI